MIVCTVLLVLLLLVFAPISFDVAVRIVPSKLCATLSVKTLSLKIAKETIELHGTKLNCSGSVSTTVDILETKPKSGIDLVKCLTMKRLCVSVQNNAFTCNGVSLVVENVVARICALVACNVTHCDLCFGATLCSCPSNVCALITARISLADILIYLVKQGVNNGKHSNQ